MKESGGAGPSAGSNGAWKGSLMDVAGFFGWLFGTRMGVLCLLGIGLLGFLVAAIVLERKTRRNYDQCDEDGDDEDGWSFFDSDNN